MGGLPAAPSDATVSAEPSHEKRFVLNRDESCRIFRADWLERLSRVHPIMPHVIYVPLVAGLLWWGQATTHPLASFGLFGLGVLLWTAAEYIIHRWAFHPPAAIEEDTRRILRTIAPGVAAMPRLPTWRHRFYFLVHGVHHDFPSDSRRLVMPPTVSVPLAGAFFWTFRLLCGPAAPAMFAGFVSGYLCYETMHYCTHQGLGWAVVRKHHFHHHYVDSSKNFGVSSPAWDYALGTIARARRRASARERTGNRSLVGTDGP